MAITSKEKIAGLTEAVRNLVEDLIVHEGMELVNVEYTSGPGGRILRLTIDKPGGVTIDDCVDISRTVSDILDVHDPITDSYNLEVSSPGINRPLVKPADFERFSGEKVFVKTEVPFHARRRFKGILRGRRDDAAVVETSDETFLIPFEIIAKARLDIL